MALINEKDLRNSYFYIMRNQKSNLDYSLFLSSNPLENYVCNVYNTYQLQKNPFDKLDVLKINSSRTVHRTNIHNKIVINAIAKKIKLLFKISNSNRNTNIEVLKNIFSRNNRITIVKLDIRKFFDNIPHDILLEIIKKHRYLDTADYHLIKNYLESSPISFGKGVHQGTELSNILAELYFNVIDKKLRKLSQNLIFSERYVDDILLIFNKVLSKNEIDFYYKKIKYEIELYKLDLNDRKTKIITIFTKKPFSSIVPEGSTANHISNVDSFKLYSLSQSGKLHVVKKPNIDFSYLGYRFVWNTDLSINKINFFMDVSPKKIYKYKTRIYKTFSAFTRHRKHNHKRNDFAYYLLRERIKFLCWTYILPDRKSDYSVSRIGITSNYKYIQSLKQIDALMKYIKNNIFYLYSVSYITKHQLNILMGIVIKNDKIISFTNSKIDDIKRTINTMSPKSISFPSNLENHEMRKYLTSVYLKSIAVK